MSEIAWRSEHPYGDLDDPGHRHDAEDAEATAPTCDVCGIPILSGACSLAGVGIACCRTHLNQLVMEHERRMARRSA